MVARSCTHICSESSPGIGEAGKTGEWRTPEALISKTIPVQIDLEYCKGCGICMQVCPAQAITMVNEGEFCSEQD